MKEGIRPTGLIILVILGLALNFSPLPGCVKPNTPQIESQAVKGKTSPSSFYSGPRRISPYAANSLPSER